MISDDEIIAQAQYYLDNDVTMEQAGRHFGVVKKTFQLRIGKLKDVSPSLYTLVQEKKERNLKLGMVKGGQNGKPTKYILNDFHNSDDGPYNRTKKYSFTKEELDCIAYDMLKNDRSLRETEAKFGIPKSTLHDNLRGRLEDDDETLINDLFDSHRNRR